MKLWWAFSLSDIAEDKNIDNFILNINVRLIDNENNH